MTVGKDVGLPQSNDTRSASPNRRIEELDSGMSASEARAHLERRGWTYLAAGDWSIALQSPAGEQVARIASWDPAHRLFVEACLYEQRSTVTEPNAAVLRHLPEIHALFEIREPGYVLVMERLYPLPEAHARHWLESIAARDPETLRLNAWLEALDAAGRSQWPTWGGFDLRPANVMVDRSTNMKLIDPVYVRGKDIADALAGQDEDALVVFSSRQLEAFLEIPAITRSAESSAFIAAARQFIVNRSRSRVR